jgi:DNA-directed RNA polymerase specialized sigma24 family protein
LRQLLSTLAPRARTTLVLPYCADLDDAAIAEAIGVSASVVGATASRALITRRNNGALCAVKETR